MATSTVPASVVKEPLRNTPMYINRIQSKNEIVFDFVQWKIFRFRKLERGIHYKNSVSELSWYLDLYKDRQTLYVKVIPKDFKKPIECFLVYDLETPIRVQETGRYEYQIPFATIQNAKNKYYGVDSLCLEFRFVRSEVTPAIRPFISGRNDIEAAELENQIRYSFLSKGFEPDFILRLTNGSSYSQKAILAARCKFFYNYLKKNPNAAEYRLDTTREIMIKLEAYILNGTAGESTKLQEMIDFLSIGTFLKIPSLQSQCERALKGNINRDNVYIIRDVGVKNGIKSLVRAADKFLGENRNLRDFGNRMERFLTRSYRKES